MDNEVLKEIKKLAKEDDRTVSAYIRICTKCKMEKNESAFSNPNIHWCKNCVKEYSKQYRLKNKEKLVQTAKEYGLHHKEEIIQRNKQYRLGHKEEILQKQKKHYLTHKKEIARKHKQYNIIHKTERNQRHYKKLKTDPLYYVRHTTRNAICKAIGRMGYTKKSQTKMILGCSFVDFKKHIESKFTKGMTWENHNTFGWHIDHKIPISVAKTEEEAIKLNHYTNLQPLWATSKIAEKYGEVNYIGNLEKNDSH